MANTYFKVLNNQTQDKFKEDIISNLQYQLKCDCREITRDIIASTHHASERRNTNNIDINTLIKYYLLEQLSKDSNINLFDNKNLAETPNPDIKKEINSEKYYMLSDNSYKHIPKIVGVNDDGTYVTNEKKSTSEYKIKRVYSLDHKPLKLQLISPNGELVSDKWQAVEILGLKKEFKYKYKYSGYSGQCFDIVSTVLNCITKPLETGLYMDTLYNFYKWNGELKLFERISELNNSPLLTDYEFKPSNIIIRKEYLGMI